jgi:hypothetical protein
MPAIDLAKALPPLVMTVKPGMKNIFGECEGMF